MTPIFLRDLALKSFRGIRSEMHLQLGGRLTVLVAPNGTGKTTVCNGVEWLLTGEVVGFSESELRCLTASQASETSVAGNIEFGQERKTLQRLIGNWRELGRPRGSITDTSVLGLLAPDAGRQERGQVANTIRRKWLRGTRLLLGHDLGVLLDSEPEASDARRRVFADLFGVQDQDAAIRQMDRYLAEIRPQASRAVKERDDLNAELERLKRQVAKPSPAAETELALAAKCLGLADFKPSTPVENALDELTVRRAQSLAHLQTRENALAFVRANAFRFTEETKRRQSLERELDQSRRSEAWSRQWNGRVEAILQRLSQAEAETEFVFQEYQDQIKDIEQYWSAGKSAGIPIDTSHSEFSAMMAKNNFRLERNRKLTVEAIAAQTEAVFEARRIRREIETHEAFKADGISEAEIDALIRRIPNMRVRWQDAEGRLKRVSGPLGMLRSTGQTLLNQVGLERHDCPLCGHDWHDGNQLRQAITTMLEQADPVIRILEMDVARLAQNLWQHEAELERLRTGRDLYLRWEEAGRTIAVITARATEFGLPEDPEAWKAEAELGKSLDGWRNWYFHLVHIAGKAGLPLERNTSIEASIIEYLEWLSSEAERYSVTLIDTRSRRERASLLSRRLSGISSAGNETAERTTQELTTIQRFIDEFSRNFETATVADIAADELEIVAINFATERERLNRALHHLEGAKASLAHGRALTRLDEFQKKLDQAVARAAQLGTRRDTALQFQEKLKAHRDNFVREQMTGLLPAVESLFGRMHANHVFDAIRSGNGSDPLQWFAEIDGKPLATAHFSQGQRQDLALSIFLARACGLKGSFFLDEPFVHLDDLNRVAMLDILRAIALSQPDVHLVLTTASRTLARHIHEKFAMLDKSLLQIIELQGDPRAEKINVSTM